LTPNKRHDTTLTIGGVSDTFSSTVLGGADKTPDPFSFIDQTGVPAGSVRTSNTVVITGISTRVTIAVVGGTYSIGCSGKFRRLPSTISNGQSVCVRHKASTRANSTVNTTLIVGRAWDTFSSTTQ
jgi:hypothetical protein